MRDPPAATLHQTQATPLHDAFAMYEMISMTKCISACVNKSVHVHVQRYMVEVCMHGCMTIMYALYLQCAMYAMYVIYVPCVILKLIDTAGHMYVRV